LLGVFRPATTSGGVHEEMKTIAEAVQGMVELKQIEARSKRSLLAAAV